MFAADSGSHYGCESECSANGYHVLTGPAVINRIHNNIKYGKYRQQTPHSLSLPPPPLSLSIFFRQTEYLESKLHICHHECTYKQRLV